MRSLQRCAGTLQKVIDLGGLLVRVCSNLARGVPGPGDAVACKQIGKIAGSWRGAIERALGLGEQSLPMLDSWRCSELVPPEADEC